MKVIGKDNFDRDDVSDIVVAVELTQAEAEKVAARLNAINGLGGPRSYEVYPDDYKPFVFEGY